MSPTTPLTSHNVVTKSSEQNTFINSLKTQQRHRNRSAEVFWKASGETQTVTYAHSAPPSEELSAPIHCSPSSTCRHQQRWKNVKSWKITASRVSCDFTWQPVKLPHQWALSQSAAILIIVHHSKRQRFRCWLQKLQTTNSTNLTLELLQLRTATFLFLKYKVVWGFSVDTGTK